MTFFCFYNYLKVIDYETFFSVEIFTLLLNKVNHIDYK